MLTGRTGEEVRECPLRITFWAHHSLLRQGISSQRAPHVAVGQLDGCGEYRRHSLLCLSAVGGECSLSCLVDGAMSLQIALYIRPRRASAPLLCGMATWWRCLETANHCINIL